MCNFNNLTDRELISLVIRERQNEDVTERLLNEFNGCLASLVMESDEQELTNIKGVGKARAYQIKAIAELAKRVVMKPGQSKMRVGCPADAANLVMMEMRYLKQEVLKVILLDTKNQILSVDTVSMGSLNSSIVSPPIIFKAAIRRSAASLILCHNHPSGDPTPSQEDISVTKRLHECGKLVGIELIDHIIIGDGRYISLKEKNIL